MKKIYKKGKNQNTNDKLSMQFFNHCTFQFAVCRLPFILCHRPLSLFLLLVAFSQCSVAQTKITLEKAIETALQNNLKVKNQKLNSDYLQKIIKTAYDIPNTGLISEYGRFNSNVNDIKIGVSQNMKFPTVYKMQKQLLSEQAKTGEWNEAIQKKELTKAITIVFYELIYQKEKEKLLLKSDSIYSEFLRKSTLRFDKGESNILEKATAENQSGQIKIQLSELQIDYKITLSKFKMLLSAGQDFVPFSDSIKIIFDKKMDDYTMTNYPSVKLFEQEINTNKSEVSLEKSKKMPELTGGVYWQTLRSNVNFQDSFNGIYGQFGVALPIFNSSFNHKIKALKINIAIAENNLDYEKIKLQNQYQNLLQEYQKNKIAIDYYETKALKNVNLIADAANKKFINGDINYLEWVILINQNTEIQSNYIEAVRKGNETIINLMNLTSK